MVSDDPSPEPDAERVQERATKRQETRAESIENILERVDGLLGEQKYPATSEELAVEYGDTMLDLANETESLGDVFDRLVDERFESPAEAREAVVNELTGQAGGPSEYDDGRALSELTDESEAGGPQP